jgi:uncharacterized protein YkwD
MARTTPRRTPNLEHLESRELLTAGGPGADAQYALEVMNLVRTNPAAGAAWVEENADAQVRENLVQYNVDLGAVKSAIAGAQPRQPLAWNARLAASSQAHSDDMARNRFQSHTGSDGSNPEVRMDKAGVGNRLRASENAFAYAESVDNAMEAFLVDWGVPDAGHRRNILDADVADDAGSSAEVGIGMARSATLGASKLVMTQNFARQKGAKAQLVGVVYDDRDGNGRFSKNEGIGNATVEVQNLDNGASTSLPTWDAGGYQIPLDPGTYQATARVGGRTLGSQRFSIGKANVKADFRLNDAPTLFATAAVAPPVTPAPQAPAPAPAPAPTPAPSIPVPSRPEPVIEAPAVAKASEATLSAVGDDWSSLSINWSNRWKAR